MSRSRRVAFPFFTGIYMNNPLHYAGLMFYQAGFERDERTTILQVVRNPSWLLPYVACGLMTFGLLLQFGIHLAGFLGLIYILRGLFTRSLDEKSA